MRRNGSNPRRKTRRVWGIRSQQRKILPCEGIITVLEIVDISIGVKIPKSLSSVLGRRSLVSEDNLWHSNSISGVASGKNN
jgi:hypothetical protein